MTPHTLCILFILTWTSSPQIGMQLTEFNRNRVTEFHRNTCHESPEYPTISKSCQRLKGRAVITPTKTYESRTIILPNVCLDQLREYHRACPETAPDAPVFIWEKRFIENGLRAGRTAAGVKHLHVHGLRHSHASYLIHRGANIALISKRLGHEKVSTTLDTYTHFFQSDEHSFIDQINADLSDN